MKMPVPTPVYRIMHIDNLAVCIKRGGFHAPNHMPADSLPYRAIHNEEIQAVRQQRTIPCGPRGTVHDYVSFYFGPRSPMLYQLHTGWVEGYDEGQTPIIYIVSTVEEIVGNRLNFVFSDGHGIANWTEWFDDIQRLDRVDWETVYATMWKDTIEDMDRQRRKQAEFLVHRFCPLEVVTEIGVINNDYKQKVEKILRQHNVNQIPVNIHHDWYY